MSADTVKEDDWHLSEAPVPPGTPGAVLIFSEHRPHLLPFEVAAGGLSIGRDELRAASIVDDRVSRRHVALARAGSLLRVTDLGSTNGVFLDGVRIPSGTTVDAAPNAVLRMGHTLFLLA